MSYRARDTIQNSWGTRRRWMRLIVIVFLPGSWEEEAAGGRGDNDSDGDSGEGDSHKANFILRAGIRYNAPHSASKFGTLEFWWHRDYSWHRERLWNCQGPGRLRTTTSLLRLVLPKTLNVYISSFYKLPFAFLLSTKQVLSLMASCRIGRMKSRLH